MQVKIIWSRQDLLICFIHIVTFTGYQNTPTQDFSCILVTMTFMVRSMNCTIYKGSIIYITYECETQVTTVLLGNNPVRLEKAGTCLEYIFIKNLQEERNKVNIINDRSGI